MDHQKSKHAFVRDALMALAARHRADRALTFETFETLETLETLETADAGWQCGRGHAWDDGVSAAQNVRCT
jgi:hypothetical protein